MEKALRGRPESFWGHPLAVHHLGSGSDAPALPDLNPSTPIPYQLCSGPRAKRLGRRVASALAKGLLPLWGRQSKAQTCPGL